MNGGGLARDLKRCWNRFAVFRGLAADPVFARFIELLTDPCPDAAGAFAASLYATGTDRWDQYLRGLVFSEETPLVRLTAEGEAVPPLMSEAADWEMGVLEAMGALSPEDLGLSTPPGWECGASGQSWLLEYREHLASMERHGFGIYARHRAFRLAGPEEDPRLAPVSHPDAVSVANLYGYERQRAAVVENTRMLLAGLPAANVLLYGDAGTGKSATVKATANLLAPEGLRLVELTRTQLHLLPRLLDELAHNPLRFVVFIDDLSFQDSDEDFSALKAVLEGGVSARAANTAIYATSNRRHLVRETFSSREGDEIHRQDTMQETLSLSERFGLRVRYDRPGRDDYLAIVKGLAGERGLELPEGQLALEAERFATRAGGRSARAARQLVDRLYVDVHLGTNARCMIDVQAGTVPVCTL
ncbi:ATP-binding protein [Olsenella sp. YH-ols2217]|uniref:ATP-binding protein n=1 Tax=Kribbibacterium absianum TaxID=3044210 RepID=A0ABT6ZI78_9ACTN|nr:MULTISPECIES: ATP-binding protein [unclassified Olsenella]MDJ1121271.1 ATP-binding protein [Olsenella sp. YH-ols2216]MDJ1128761.1 ATP-binding protein [Olsenella sp. YH-ols2217]